MHIAVPKFFPHRPRQATESKGVACGFPGGAMDSNKQRSIQQETGEEEGGGIGDGKRGEKSYLEHQV